MQTQTLLPTVSELVATAIDHTDFDGEAAGTTTTTREMYRAATIATNQAAESWEEAAGLPIGATVPDSIRNAVALALVRRAEAAQERAIEDSEAAFQNAVAAGDLDHDGNPVAYDFCRSA